MRYGKFGLAMAIMALPIFTNRGGDLPDVTEMSDKIKSGDENETTIAENSAFFEISRTNEVYNERMIGVFQDAYDLKYI